MKRRLLKPPENDKEILIIPDYQKILSWLTLEKLIGVCHQPYFFNSGVSLKFLFLEKLPRAKKEIIFLDTDRIKLEVKVPFRENQLKLVKLLDTEEILYDYPTPSEKLILSFLTEIETGLKKLRGDFREVKNCYSKFKEIFLSKINKKFFKQVLAESFLEYSDIKIPYSFLSEHLKSEEFKNMFLDIYTRADEFREAFNTALDEYKKEYRFRYKNFPYPKLEKGELPFWIVKEGKRFRCFKDNLDISGSPQYIVFPRAVALTIFLRLYRFDIFIHGIGGANYEPVQDKLIKYFFKQDPPPYLIISGTFFLPNFKERELPYFFFNQSQIRKVFLFNL